MKAQVLLDTFFEQYDHDDGITFYGLKDDEHVIITQGRHMTEMLTLANTEDGDILFFCADPEQDPVINVDSGDAEVEVTIYEKVETE